MFRRATTGILARTIRARLFSTGLPAAQTIDSTFAEAWKKVAPNLDPPKTPLSFMQPRLPTPSAIPSKLTVNFVLPYASEISGKEVFFPLPGLKDACLLLGFLINLVNLMHFGICGYVVESAFLVLEIARFAGCLDLDMIRSILLKNLKFELGSVGRTTGATLLKHFSCFCHAHTDRGEGDNLSELQTKRVDMVIIPASTGQMGVLPGHVSTITELKPGVLSVHEGNEVKKYFVSSGFAFIHANSIADIVAVEAAPLDQIDTSLVQKGLAEFTQKLSSASTDLEKAEAQIGVDVHSALNAALTG
ncbi:hypothetical protein POTOM_047789 [Populus tomentosa]|uniref:ATP synthase F1 complex delta/epsilon subunit N-terminal domain-containing protein n=1 Tax=Populus tomentosa TaxID=118781 RepID=A0A8X7Y7Y0_POPTO|nr:hypothetical protein POTOM_047789 [Populus tomentosa]